MAMSRRNESRYLDADERELVDKTRGAALRGLGDDELEELIRLVRERRKRARDVGHRQRREMRGKAEPAGASAASPMLSMKSPGIDITYGTCTNFTKCGGDLVGSWNVTGGCLSEYSFAEAKAK